MEISLCSTYHESTKNELTCANNHNCCEGNKSGFSLSNSSTTIVHLNLIVLETPPSDLQQFLFDDVYGTHTPRNVNLILHFFFFLGLCPLQYQKKKKVKRQTLIKEKIIK
jgi:hypothetical protein